MVPEEKTGVVGCCAVDTLTGVSAELARAGARATRANRSREVERMKARQVEVMDSSSVLNWGSATEMPFR